MVVTDSSVVTPDKTSIARSGPRSSRSQYNATVATMVLSNEASSENLLGR
ncbi:hypothetical protein [Bradyrhizobium genosp. P]